MSCIEIWTIMNHNHQYMQENIVFRGNLYKRFFSKLVFRGSCAWRSSAACRSSDSLRRFSRNSYGTRTTGQQDNSLHVKLIPSNTKKNKVILEMTTCAHPVKWCQSWSTFIYFIFYNYGELLLSATFSCTVTIQANVWRNMFLDSI